MSNLYVRDKSGKLVPIDSISVGGGVTVIREDRYAVYEEVGTVLQTKLTPAEFAEAAKAGGMELHIMSDDNIDYFIFQLHDFEIDGRYAYFTRANDWSVMRIDISIAEDGTMTVEDISEAVVDLSDIKREIVNAIYPIGAIYMSYNSTSPAVLFGGSWTQIQNRFLLAAGSSYSAGSTGGEATHTLTVDEMPSHRHDADFWSSKAGDAGYQGSCATNYDCWNRPTERAIAQVQATGGGQPHNNMPPYLVVFMWRRTA